jgi:S-adenosylmethionine hydrolase
VHIDHFGNIITDVWAEDLGWEGLVVEVAGSTIGALSRTCGQREGLVAYVGSSGYLEVALVGGSAAAALKGSIGLAVVARPVP